MSGAPSSTAVAGAGAPAPAPKKESVSQWSTKKLTTTLRLINMVNGLLLITCAILEFIIGGLATISFSTVTVAMYVTFFGLMMTCLECNIGNLAPKFKKNFGFMFSFAGRTLYIIFCATMCYAFNNWLGWVVGSLTMLNGLFNGYVICVHPSFRSGELSAMGDPFGGYTGGEGEMLAYLKKNPALAQKAGAAAVTFAKDNPDVAMQVASAAAAQPAAGAAPPGGNPWGFAKK